MTTEDQNQPDHACPLCGSAIAPATAEVIRTEIVGELRAIREALETEAQAKARMADVMARPRSARGEGG